MVTVLHQLILTVFVQVVKSDTDGDGASESESTQKKAAQTPRPDVIMDEQCSHQEVTKKLHNISISQTGTTYTKYGDCSIK